VSKRESSPPGDNFTPMYIGEKLYLWGQLHTRESYFAGLWSLDVLRVIRQPISRVSISQFQFQVIEGNACRFILACNRLIMTISNNYLCIKSALAVWSTTATDEWKLMGREIESRQGYQLKKYIIGTLKKTSNAIHT
jgi:hypothetical protein